MGVTSMALEIESQLCEINFAAMNRRIATTGLVLPIDRRTVSSTSDEKDERNDLLETDLEPFLEFVGSIFPLLVDIGSNSTDSVLRYDCVRVMVRMLYAVRANAQLLTCLKDVPLAAYISSTLSSSKNVALVALAVQLSNVLLEKLPDLYIPLFDSEG
jgi:E3 ubiquitin-protein ligase TRIP12